MESPTAKLYFNYQIFEEEKLMIETFKGTMTLDMMKNFKANEANDKLFHKEINVISDIRQLKFDGTMQEVIEYADFTIKHGEIIGKRKTAIIFATPNQHAYAYVYKKANLHLPIEIGLFQTTKDALLWLEQTIEDKIIDEHLKQLKTKGVLLKH